MVTLDTYRTLAQALPGVSEQIHHGMPAFRVGTKRFSIFDPKKGMLALRLPLTDPDRATGIAVGLLVPAPGRYGTEGWAEVDMERIDRATFETLLGKAHASI